MNFVPGDNVMLKSGGPTMTIESIGDYTIGRRAKCVWFEGKKLMHDLFALETLQKIE